MSEPRPLPPLPQPFAAEPRRLETRAGCGRGALVGCGVLVALLGVAAVALSFRAQEITVWLLRKVETKIASALPADLTAAERQRFASAFSELYGAVQRGEVEREPLAELQRQMMAIAADVDRGLEREQVVQLTAAVERAAGVAPAEPPGDERPPP